MSPPNIFLLSPARVDGARARTLMSPRASFELARRLRSDEGAPVGEVFSFLSALYFRGKLEYARTFGAAIKVITTDSGLLAPSDHITLEDLEAFSEVDLSAADPRYLEPLRRDAEILAGSSIESASVVLLGSVATGKYVDVLLSIFGERLMFPAEFVGRGDMSRGGLLLRHARARQPLDYIPVLGAVRRGKRPPKLPRI
jgi:hypothetical protein